MSADIVSDLVRFHLDPTGAPPLPADVLPALTDVFRDQVATLSPSKDAEPLHLLLEVAGNRFGPARAAFRAEARTLLSRAQALLESDRLKRPESRKSGDGAMGELGALFIDPTALAETLDRRSGGTALPEPRRERLSSALEDLEGFLAAAEAPPLILVHDGLHPVFGDAQGDEAPPPWRMEIREDPCAGAAVIFDREAEGMARVLRAVRRIRLEADGSYEPERHDPWLDRFDWQAFSRDELLLLPSVAALTTADQVARSQMAALSSLLLSGRPVQVLISVQPARDPGADPGADPFAGFRFEPAYLGLSHRQSLVHQTSTAQPGHMEEGFCRSLTATRASLHVIASSRGGKLPRLEAELYAAMAVAGRAHPLFHYDPEAGSSWAERLDFACNPSPGDDWPTYQLAPSPDGGDEPLEPPFTFADFALLEPAYARHFQPVPDGMADDQLVPLARWARLPAIEANTPIPFIWAIDGASRRVRLAVSRALALACRDRLGFWNTLQELSGARSVYAQRAGVQARLEAEEAARQELERVRSEHAAELERLRQGSTRDVVDRLTAALLELDVATLAGTGQPPAAVSPLGWPAAMPAPPEPEAKSAPEPSAPEPAAPEPSAPEPSAPEPAAPQTDAPESDVEADTGGLEPYIDTELCTTCNECTNLNPKMFAYDDNKQAYVKDPRAGTFAQLVQAAEKCTAAIIHPGTPLDPDEPDLEKWEKRAERFN